MEFNTTYILKLNRVKKFAKEAKKKSFQVSDFEKDSSEVLLRSENFEKNMAPLENRWQLSVDKGPYFKLLNTVNI